MYFVHILTLLQGIAGIVYVFNGDIARGLYWLALVLVNIAWLNIK